MTDINTIQNVAVPILANIPQNEMLTSIQSVFAVVAAVIFAAYPIMQMFKKWNADKAENSISNAASSKAKAEAFLYTHLQEQIERTQKDLESAKEENRNLNNIIRSMEDRIKKLEAADEIIVRLKSKLDEKDTDINIKNAVIAQRELKIHELFDIILIKDKEISDLKIRVETLERRLSNDEQSWAK